jgi:HlyD family secretion protein
MQRFFKNWVVAVAVLALVLAGGILWWRSRGGEKLSFTTADVKRGEVSATISASGTIEPLEVVDIGAQVEGRISGFGTDTAGKTVDYGSTVTEGSLLAKIDDSVYAADLSVSKAGLLSAQANVEQMNAKLDQAAAEWKRAQDLFASKLIAQVDFESDKANYEIAKANLSVADSGVEQAKADLEKAQRNLDFCTIKSPVSGVIIDRRVNAGQTVVSSLSAPSLFLIARDLTKMQIWVSVNEADVGRIKAGMPVDFTVDAFPSRDFKGVVGKVRLNAQMTQNVVLYTVEINIENPDKLLMPYLTANVHFLVDHEANTLMVPNAALRWSPTSMAEVAPEARKDNLVDPPGEVHVATPPGEKTSEKKNSKRTLWVKSGDFVRPVEVNAGISDGANTAVASNDLHEGDEVVTGDIAGGQSNVSNPFLPKIMRR